MNRCHDCPVPAGPPCRGEVLRHKCGDPRYRAYFVRRAETGEPESAPAPDAPPGDDLLANAESCPHRVPMPDDRRTGCGCRHLCTAGMGPKRRKGGVTLADCWACPIAPGTPRLHPPPIR